MLGVAFAVGSLPLANLAASRLAGVDLRRIGTGTVSGTSLYEVTSLGPLALVGCLEVAKGAVGPALAGRSRPELGAVAAGLGVAGHNWSPWLRGAGGRGISPALGATAALAPEATVVLSLGLGVGRLAGQTGLGCLVAMVSLIPLLVRTRGRPGWWIGTAVTAPLLVKRALGNQPPSGASRGKVYVSRLVFDRDNLHPGTEGRSPGSAGG